MTVSLRPPTAIFKPGYRYAKAGVMLFDLQDADAEQIELDLDAPS